MDKMRLALRKTVEGFSAGTRVDLVGPFSTNDDWRNYEKVSVSPLTGPDRNYMFDVNVDDLVVLRKRGNQD